MKPITLLAAVVALLIAIGFTWTVQVRTDFAFICRSTGSRYGYHQWRVIGQTGRWYEASPLEEFMKKQHPQLLHHKWVSYAGTGKNLFGKNLSFGHGRPGLILMMDKTIWAAYCAKTSDDEKLRLYQTLETDDEDARRFALDTALAIAMDMPLPATNAVAKPGSFE